MLLDNLGAFQDTEVQANKLREFAHQMVKEGSGSGGHVAGHGGMLVDGLLRRQQEARKDFHSCFNLFAGKENRKEFKAIFFPLFQGIKIRMMALACITTSGSYAGGSIPGGCKRVW